MDTAKIIDTVFLRTLTSGKHLTLYNYTDNIKTRYIIFDKHTQSIKELSYHLYTDTANAYRVITRNGFRNELAAYIYTYKKDDNKIIAVNSRLNYNEDIVKIVNQINDENKNKVTSTNRSGYRLYAGAALNNSILKYTGDIALSQNAQNKASIFPEIMVGIDGFQNSNVGRLLLRLEAGFAPYHQLTAMGDNSVQTVEQQNAYLSPQIMYNFYNSAAVKVFIASGVNFNFSQYRKNSFSFANDPGIVPQNNFPEMEKTWFQVPVKAGITFNNKVEIYGDYEFSSPLTINYIYFQGNVKTTKVGVNYLFGKHR